MTSSGIQLVPGNCLSIEMCIICQTKSDVEPIFTDRGRIQVIEAARIRNDGLLERIRMLGDNFVYHMTNKCYKGYTHTQHLDRLNTGQLKQTISSQKKTSEDRTTCSQV